MLSLLFCCTVLTLVEMAYAIAQLTRSYRAVVIFIVPQMRSGSFGVASPALLGKLPKSS